MSEETFTRLRTWGTENIELYTSRFNYNKLLDLYANYARVTYGTNTAPQPNTASKEYLKWKAWNAVNDKTTEQAMEDYISIIRSLNDELIRLGVMEPIE